MKKLLLFVVIGFILISCKPPEYGKDVNKLADIIVQRELIQNRIDSIQIVIDSANIEMGEFTDFSYEELQTYLDTDTLKLQSLLRVYNRRELLRRKDYKFSIEWNQLDERYDKYYRRVSFKYGSDTYRALARDADKIAANRLNIY